MTTTSSPGDKSRQRLRSVRAGAALTMLTPLCTLVYVATTWSAGNRPAMAMICVSMLVLAAVALAGAQAIERAGRRATVQMAGLVVNIAGFTALALLDGGLKSAVGAYLPFLVIMLAVGMPLRPFLAVAGLAVAGYWTVAIIGGPAQMSYAVIHTIHTGIIATLCLRYSAAMVSLQRRLSDLSRIDPLTGCLNRRGFEERLANELAEAERTGDSAVLLLVDLDGFKEINDRYGHQAGDDLLVWTGRTIDEQLRTHDAVGRVGGDEFAAVLSGIEPDGVPVVLERLHAALDGVASAGIGYACYPAEATSPEALKEIADRRVYRDKVDHNRQVPAEAAVAGARGDGARRQSAKVSRHERRRRAITETGRLGISTPGMGLLYVLLFAGGHPNRWLMATLLTVAVTLGVTTVAAAARLSRSSAAAMIMPIVGALQFTICTVVVCLDGGASSTPALGMLTTLPLIALISPRAVLLPFAASAFVAIAVFVGVSSTWYAIGHLTSALVVSLVCASRGRVAAEQRRKLRELSRVDALTQCLNRRGFMERSTAELAHAHRHRRDLSLLILDLDRFKEVNDSEGHAAGDELLCWVGATLRERLHPHDVVGRLGGDEFVVLLSSHSAGETDDVAGDLEAALAERIGVSVGAGVLGRHGTDLEGLYAHADAELYRRKLARGRGRSRRPAAPADGNALVA
ncbi:GGDEF domain-containing protein [Krasilnikovia cinnamomea]|uniref:GGDEF domain-containing protein n=1 Tax=Krasilnikovia cinnamomea TaxID=349313 RepID=UPI001A91AAC6|nr:GGDEF domain-containing protein [Krasilnikovia cinnamomea]